MWRFLGLLLGVAAVVAVFMWKSDSFPTSDSTNGVTNADTRPAASRNEDSGANESDEQDLAAPPMVGTGSADPIVITDANVIVIHEQEVPTRIESGVVKSVKVVMGQKVAADEILAELDARRITLLKTKQKEKADSTWGKKSSEEELKIAVETVNRDQELMSKSPGSVSQAERNLNLAKREVAKLRIKKAEEETSDAKNDLKLAELEADFHNVRSAIAGEVTAMHKKEGEAVKQLEPIFRIANYDRLRIEGFVELQQANQINAGMKAKIYPETPAGTRRIMSGHTAAVTSLAISPDGRILASAGEDDKVILWAWQGAESVPLRHPGEVYAVASGPIIKGTNKEDLTYVFLTGCSDGKARIWRLPTDPKKKGQRIDLANGHYSAIRCVAFSPNGKFCASGGDDRHVCIWDAENHMLLYRLHAEKDQLSPAHRNAVTAVHFTPDGYLVSAAQDNVIKVWKLTDAGGELVGHYRGRTGSVAQLGISSDGKRLLFDHGDELRILNRDTGSTMGLIRSRGRGDYQALAVFSPSDQLVLTCAALDRVQLVTPAGNEVRYLPTPDAAAVTCGVFAPNGRVVFTAGRDKVVRAWEMPTEAELKQPMEAEITFVGSQLESNTGLVKIRAEFNNPADKARRIMPGTRVHLTLNPEVK